MKVYFVVSKWDEGAWISDDDDCDVAYASYELALRELAKRDAIDYQQHLKNEENRKFRIEQAVKAKQILEEAGVDDSDNILRYGSTSYVPYKFESNYIILQLEVKNEN